MQPLTLGRVPPNLLVGKGATEFARENGLEIVPNENMISKNAGHRFLRWQSDISRTRAATDPNLQSQQPPRRQQASGPRQTDQKGTPATSVRSDPQNDSVSHRPSHGETSPILPPSSGPASTTQPANTACRAARSLMATIRSSGGHSKTETSDHESRSEDSQPRSSEVDAASPMAGSGDRAPPLANERAVHSMALGRESSETSDTQLCSSVNQEGGGREEATSTPQEPGHRGNKRSFGEFQQGNRPNRCDHITDTVGAIAIDGQGRIAAGSSSGGIGMKHSGRLGPAALVGVGSAVIPSHPNDPDQVSVAVVTSGTGEHMATTMASQKCAERLLRNTRQGPMGEDAEEPSDHDAVKAFVLEDFMDHPGVKSMPSTAAIGVLAVKKYKERYYVYFAHNTESFALASMGHADKEPMCLMSRMGNNPEKCSVGARRIQFT